MALGSPKSMMTAAAATVNPARYRRPHSAVALSLLIPLGTAAAAAPRPGLDPAATIGQADLFVFLSEYK